MAEKEVVNLKTRLVSTRRRMFLDRVFLPPPAGLSSNVVPMYLGELAPKNLRGALGVVPQLFITVGILVAQIFGLRTLLANKEGELRTPPPTPPALPCEPVFSL